MMMMMIIITTTTCLQVSCFLSGLVKQIKSNQIKSNNNNNNNDNNLMIDHNWPINNLI